MDSIYELPRTAPVPSSLEKVPAIPVVPEVSMIFQNSANINNPSVDSMYLTYNEWKARHQKGPITAGTNHNYTKFMQAETKRSTNDSNPESIARRQVRFESPLLHQHVQNRSSAPSENLSHLPSSTSHMPIASQKSNLQNCIDSNVAVQPIKMVKPFEQIYMANVPNRHLDLSMIEPPKFVVANKENVCPNINAQHYKQNQNIVQTKSAREDFPHYFKNGVTTTHRDNLRTERNDGGEFLHKGDAPQGKQKEDITSNSHKTTHLNTSGITEKKRVIDLYNYNRDSLTKLKSDYERRYTLDNVKLGTKANANEVENQKHVPPYPNAYESFTSHNCGSNKYSCKCANGKELPGPELPSNSRRNLEVSVVDKNTDDPTVKDLLKIIQQQNDQLLILQNQVATLLNTRDAAKQIEAPPVPNRNPNLFGEQYRTSTQLETEEALCNAAPNFLPKKGPLPQFSMDVMTSFEVSIRRPQNFNRARKSVVNHQPKICEVTETDSDVSNESRNLASNNLGNVLEGISNKHGRVGDDTFKNTDVSLTFNEPVQVQETCPSPVNSVEIHMNDYSFDSDQEDSSEGAGWTFYNNMMHQVNHILKKSGIQPSNERPVNINEAAHDPAKRNMMKKVKEATIKHLKSIGVHVPSLDDADDSFENDPTNRMGCKPNEVSFAVKQLLMKYLPDEQLAKITYMQRENAPLAGNPGLIKRRPEFSFATVQYMQKYNLLNDVPNGHKIAHQSPVVQQNEDFDRILDATAIRQQPKLL